MRNEPAARRYCELDWRERGQQGEPRLVGLGSGRTPVNETAPTTPWRPLPSEDHWSALVSHEQMLWHASEPADANAPATTIVESNPGRWATTLTVAFDPV